MIIGIFDSNDCNYAVNIKDLSQTELAKKLMLAGHSTWYSAAHVPVEGNEYFPADEVASFYGTGYAEPACELFDRYGIEYEMVNIEYDDEDEPTNLDDYITY